MLTKSNAKAYAVLSIIMDNLSDEEISNLSIDSYANGREHGFALQFYLRAGLQDVKCVFSENRNSDSIVVYTDESWKFSMQGNTPSDEAYNARRFFEYNAYDAAAQYVLTQLRTPKTVSPNPTA